MNVVSCLIGKSMKISNIVLVFRPSEIIFFLWNLDILDGEEPGWDLHVDFVQRATDYRD